MTKDDENLSPALRQYLEIKRQYPDCIIFFRLGDFYEMFFEDAITASKILDLILTGKDCGLEERAPMCGVPFHAYESYAQKLIERGFKIAICEQTDKVVNKLIQREVVRVITPGTVIDSSMLNEKRNTYIMCIYKSKHTISYTYGDLSTGEINVAEYTGDNYLNYLNDQIVRIMPAEIICNGDMFAEAEKLPCMQDRQQVKFSQYYDWAFSQANSEKQILKQYRLNSLKGYDFATDACICAVGALLQYFVETQKRDLKHLKMPKLIMDEQFMYVDTNTRRNLEIEQTMRDGSKVGTLFWVLDETLTSGGSRMLRSWVRQPLQNRDAINLRLDMVEFLYNNSTFREEIKIALSHVQDIERLVGRVSLGNISPRDCLALAESLQQANKIKEILNRTGNAHFLNLAARLTDTTEICNLIFATISETAGQTMKDGNYIRPGFNAQLDKFRELKENAQNFILQIQEREREATGIRNLKIGYNRVFGYYIEVNKQFSEQVPFRYIRKQTISNNERYITEELKNLEEEILTSTENALKLEEKIYSDFKAQLLENASIMQGIAIEVSTLDCLNSLATVAVLNNYARPNITTGNEINIVDGRHPVVEKMISKGSFIPNDCHLNNSDQRTMILTGPNMAGKSTYMRQVALITYLAHIGSFVPATRADICIVDRIFTRIGASDDLAVGQSTFMVEMIEVANILNYSTNNSLIILDEVGRGTSTFDGLSIAWAVVEHLSKNLKAKTLFATHYHELMQMEGKYDGVKNFCISIKEIGGKLVFLRKIMRGGATKSYGIEVASLAGLPEEIINRAKQLMSEFESEKQVDAASKDSEIVNILKETDINKLSPLTAFDTLAHLIDLAK